MSLVEQKGKDLDLELLRLGIVLVECSICGSCFSSTMKWAWPFCTADIPHEKMESKEQIRRQYLLSGTPEKATASFVMPYMKLYSPNTLKVSFSEGNLPDWPEELQTVTLMKEKFKKFSNDYKIVGTFIGNILGKHNWSMADLIDYSFKAWEVETE